MVGDFERTTIDASPAPARDLEWNERQGGRVPDPSDGGTRSIPRGGTGQADFASCEIR